MKNRNLKTTALIVGSVFALTNASAATLNAMYDSQSQSVNINADTDSLKALASVIVLPSAADISSVTDEQMTQYTYKPVRTDANGDWTDSIKIPSSYASGSYSVHFICGDDKLSAQFSYINKTELAQIISEKINPASNGAEIAAIIKDNAQSFGLDDETVAKYDNILGALIYAGKPGGGYGVDSFETEYAKATAVARIKSGEDVGSVMKLYAPSFGITAADFDGISAEAKEMFAANVKSADTAQSADNIFKESFFTAVANTSLSYVDLKNNVYKYASVCGANLSCLNGFSDEDISRAFAAVGTNFASVSDFNTRIAAAAASVINGGGTTGGGTSGGGGGGSSSKGGSAFETDGSAAPSAAYADIATHWAKEYIAALSGKGIINGYEDGTFRPDNQITRAEFAKLLITLSGRAPVYKDVFADVSAADWSYGYIAAASDMGLITGYNGNFEPNGLITKQDAAVMLYRYAQSRGLALGGDAQFDDSALIADYAAAPVGALASGGVISGADGRFYPTNNTTRAEAATLIYKLLSLMKEV